jgi:uncharacterized protein (DUF58 family)
MPAELTPEILARIDRMELDAKGVVEGFLAGRHKSPRHGFAVEFAQHREYAPGDDIKHIDWKVYGRTERYHLKQYEQETNLVAWMIVDGSESMNIGTVKHSSAGYRTKYDVASTLAAALAYLIANQADTIGLQLYSQRAMHTLKPLGGMGRVREIIRTCADGPYKQPSNTGLILRELAGQLGRRGVVFVFSDLLDDVADLVAGLRVLRSQKHEVVVFHILDAAELDFPFRQPTLFKGLEEFPELSTDPLSIRETYLSGLKAHLDEIQTQCRMQEIDYTLVRSDADLGLVLAEYLQRRQGR